MKWFKKRKYPIYWENYLKSFNKKQNINLDELKFIVFDTETTGLDVDNDRILSIGTIAVNKNILKVNDSLECYLKQDFFNSETVKIHGLLKENKKHKIDEEKAIILFLEHIKNSVLVAHHAAFDIAMINQSLKRLGLPKLKNKVIDTGVLFKKTSSKNSKNHFSLDELSKRFNIPSHDRHTASGDAYITAILFLKLISIIKNNNTKTTLNQLLQNKKRIGLL